MEPALPDAWSACSAGAITGNETLQELSGMVEVSFKQAASPAETIKLPRAQMEPLRRDARRPNSLSGTKFSRCNPKRWIALHATNDPGEEMSCPQSRHALE